MKVAVIGANGQLGSDVAGIFRENGDEVAALTHQDIEILEPASVEEALVREKPDMVINTAAYHNVEQCEYTLHDAFAGNALGAKHLAEAAVKLGFYLIHISTDYVFAGNHTTPYVESDLPSPLNAYANTKLSGEHFVRSIAEHALVIRTCGLYGRKPCRAKGGNNFVELMLHFARSKSEVRVVDNEVLTPTSTMEVARQILALSRKPLYGLCHATAEGHCSWYEFADRIYRIMKWDVNLNVAAPGEFPTAVRRPAYSVLENQLLKANGLNTFQHWEAGLRHYLLSEHGAFSE